MFQKINPWRGLEELPRPFWILFSATLVNRSGTMALPFLILYLTRSLDFSPAEASWIFIAYGIGSATGPVAGKLVDRYGTLKIMRNSLLLSGTALVFFPLFHSGIAISIATLIWAITGEAFRPAALTAVGRLVAPDQKKSAFAAFRLAINIGMSIGPVVGGFLALYSYPLLFISDGATSILAGLTLWIWPWKEVTPEKRHASLSRSPLREPRLLLFITAMTLVLIVFFQMDATVPLFTVEKLRLSEFYFGLLLTFNTGIIIFIEYWLNNRLSHWSLRRTLTLGAFLVGAGFGSMFFAVEFWTAAFTVILWTFGEMLLFPGAAAYLSKIAPPDQEGEFMGYYQMTFSAGLIVGPWLGVQIFEMWGWDVLWISMFAIGILATAIMYFQIKEEK